MMKRFADRVFFECNKQFGREESNMKWTTDEFLKRLYMETENERLKVRQASDKDSNQYDTPRDQKGFPVAHPVADKSEYI